MLETISFYWIIIFACAIIVISYGFDLLAKRTNIPSVLMLILVGIIITAANNWYGIAENFNFLPALEILGTLGLIMIILEAAIDLRLTREKLPLIAKSFSVALLLLIVTSAVTAYIIHYFLSIDLSVSLLYAVTLSVMSSAIIIPSVSSLEEKKKEFMIYEATFSDILGIIFFYFLLDTIKAGNFTASFVEPVNISPRFFFIDPFRYFHPFSLNTRSRPLL